MSGTNDTIWINRVRNYLIETGTVRFCFKYGLISLCAVFANKAMETVSPTYRSVTDGITGLFFEHNSDQTSRNNEAQKAAKNLREAIEVGAEKSGIPAQILMAIAYRESGLDCNAENGNTIGLHQINYKTTMPRLVGLYAEQSGYDYLLQYIKVKRTMRPDGLTDIKYYAASPQAYAVLAEACRNPEISATLTGCHLKGNAEALKVKLNRNIKVTDAYMAHFLGLRGATRFLRAYDDPRKINHKACDYVSEEAAEANRSVFFDGERPRSISEVYKRIERSLNKAPRIETLPKGQKNKAPPMLAALWDCSPSVK